MKRRLLIFSSSRGSMSIVVIFILFWGKSGKRNWFCKEILRRVFGAGGGFRL